MKPASDKTGVPIRFADQDTLAAEYFKLLRSGEMCGKLTFVSWKHSYIPQIARRLACTTEDGCPTAFPEDSFDQVWQLKYVFDPSWPHDLPSEIDYVRNSTLHRNLKGEATPPARVNKHRGWRVYATVDALHFDPLAYSYRLGDYPEGGKPTGGPWDNVAMDL